MQRHIFAAAVLIFIMSFAVGGFTAPLFHRRYNPAPGGIHSGNGRDRRLTKFPTEVLLNSTTGTADRRVERITNVQGPRRRICGLNLTGDLDGESGGGDDGRGSERMGG